MEENISAPIDHGLIATKKQRCLRPLAMIAKLICLAGLSVGHAQQPGEQNYQAFCSPCHTMGSGRLVGPDLAGVGDRRSTEWLLEFVQSSQAMVARGDPDAVALVAEYANLVMPDPPLSADEITDVVTYMIAAGSDVASTAPAQEEPATAVVEEPPSEAAIASGRDLFQGSVRLTNGGASCNACHDVVNDAVIGGGSLSVDLTTAYTRLTGAGIRAMLTTPAFPVMQAAYDGRSLNPDEVEVLAAFLWDVDQQSESHTARRYGFRLLVSGSTGTAALFGFFAFVWRGRKRESVNQSIFERQDHATWED